MNRILNISLVTKIIKKLDLYAYSVHKWAYGKAYFGKTRYMYLMIKYENIFDK